LHSFSDIFEKLISIQINSEYFQTIEDLKKSFKLVQSLKKTQNHPELIKEPKDFQKCSSMIHTRTFLNLYINITCIFIFTN
jgi:hypothetical protein